MFKDPVPQLRLSVDELNLLVRCDPLTHGAIFRQKPVADRLSKRLGLEVDKKRGLFFSVDVWSLMFYNPVSSQYHGIVDDYLLRLKRRDKMAESPATLFARIAAQAMTQGHHFIGMPSHTEGPAEGGVRRFASELARLSDGADASECLIRTQTIVPLSQGGQRDSKALETSLAVVVPEILRGRSVVLVDDIVTSGSSMAAACAVLAKAGVAPVHCLTIARTAR